MQIHSTATLAKGAARLESSSANASTNPADMAAFSGLLDQMQIPTASTNSLVGEQSLKLDKETQEKIHRKSEEQDLAEERLDLANLGAQSMLQKIQGKETSQAMGEARFQESMDQVNQKLQQKSAKIAEKQVQAGETAPAEVASQKNQTEVLKFDKALTETQGESKTAGEKTMEANKPQAPKSEADAKAQTQAYNLARVIKPHGSMTKEVQALQTQGLDGAKGLKAEGRTNLAKPQGEATLTQLKAEKTGTTSKTLEAKAVQGPDRFEEMKNAKELAEKMKVMIRTGKNEMTLRMTPEHLGRMEVKLTKDGDEMIAKMTVASTEAKELLESQMPELLENLMKEGIEVQRVEIHTQNEQSQFAMNQDARENSSAPKEGMNPALTTSEGSNLAEELTAPKLVEDPNALLNLYA